VANTLAEAVPEAVKLERQARLMELQGAISADKLVAKVGRKMTVLVDECDEEGAIGRTSGDAPEVDGVVFLDADETTLRPGEWVEVEITDSDAHDLYARRT